MEKAEEVIFAYLIGKITKVEAIKHIRDICGVPLKPAKDFVEAYEYKVSDTLASNLVIDGRKP